MNYIEANAQILITQHYDLRGNTERYTYKWDGPKNGIVAMSAMFLRQLDPSLSTKDALEVGDIVRVGPYKLKVFSWSDLEWNYYFVRQDSFTGNIRATAYRLTRWLDLIYRRLIITAAVWNLAMYDPSQIPSWKDLYITRRLRRK